MAFREGPLADIKVPVTWAATGATVVAAVIALLVLLAAGRQQADTGSYGRARTEFDEVIEPVAAVFATPVRWAVEGADYVRGYFFAVSENRQLRERVGELERWRDAAIALKNVNTRYEALLKLKTEPPIPMVSARVVSDARGPFSNARIADAGSAQGVREGYPVMSEHGVVGRVVGAAAQASRILLLTDADSRTPVMIDRTNARAILTGDGGAAPRLEYLRGPDPVRPGDLVLTSGDGGVFPRGLPVGVAGRDVRGVWRVRLYAERQSLDYVRILQFEDFSHLTPAAELERHVMPPLTPQQASQVAAAAQPAPPVVASGTPTGTTPSASASPATAVSPSRTPTIPGVKVKPKAKPKLKPHVALAPRFGPDGAPLRPVPYRTLSRPAAPHASTPRTPSPHAPTHRSGEEPQ